MGNQLVLAVAGAGKTTKILSSLAPEKRSLIVTYTQANFDNVRRSIRKKFGHIPHNIEVYTYFSFLYQFCFRPYCSYLIKDKSYRWEGPPRVKPWDPSAQKDHPRHYWDANRYLYYNRVAKYLINNGVVPKIVARLDRFFDQLLIDEIQDFASYDFDFIIEIAKARADCLYVGDFHQHTFDTSRDGNKNTNLYKNGVTKFTDRFRGNGFDVDTTSLERTYRCTQQVCDFITNDIGIPISSNRLEKSKVHIVDSATEAMEIFENDQIVKLFYQGHNKYPCASNNWGRCKGLDHYNDVCVVLNSTTQKKFTDKDLSNLSESTKHKLYVACSRARGDLILMNEKLIRHLKSG